MEQASKSNISDALHVELHSVLEDLAKSVDVAVTRIVLRAKCTAVIADATEAERAAGALRAAAENSFNGTEQLDVSLVPRAKNEKSLQNRTENANPWAPMDEIYAACNWLATANATQPQKQDPGPRSESAIAMRVLELHDRLGGLIKK